MAEYMTAAVSPSDKGAMAKVEALLEREGIRRDGNLDYTCAVYDDDYEIIATGSCFGNTLRCMAVSSAHQGEGLMNLVVSHLVDVQYRRGNTRLFLYTKVDSAKFFRDLGFYEIARVGGKLVFMENRASGFRDYLAKLAKSKKEGRCGAVVVNANPFTLGHQYLIERAASECDVLHLFAVSEDASLVPFAVRKKLIVAGTAHILNVVHHDSGPYIISSATFPSYFLKDEETVIESHARLDLAVFVKIAAALGVSVRYVGEEKASRVTSLYNDIMRRELPAAGVECVVVPRREADGAPISASTVRTLLKRGDFDALAPLVPATTLDYFKSADAAPVLERIRSAENVVHY